jgi:amidohydrolase
VPTAHAALTTSELVSVYEDLHAHPELAFQETRTAALVSARLEGWGFQVTSGVGGTGVVGVLDNGPGATVLLRADMDALPVEEQTGLPYASIVRATDAEGADVPVMHACGHDVHVTCLLGAASVLSSSTDTWTGRLMVVFQPAEEQGTGAQAMVDDGLFGRFGRPDVVLGQHVAPLPAGTIGLHAGVSFAASDSLRVTLHGRGGHGSRPEATVDPVVMAAATVMRLQTVVSRETGGTETAVVTVGSMHAGSQANVIPQEAVLEISVRTVDAGVRDRTLEAIRRISLAEAQAAGAPQPATVEHLYAFPAVVNDDGAVAEVRAVFGPWLGGDRLVDPGVLTGSEDVGLLATAAGAPCAYWLLGGTDPVEFAGAKTLGELMAVMMGLPNNHSPHFAPVPRPTLAVGVTALVVAARAWLAPGGAPA